MVRLTCWLFPVLLVLPSTLAVPPENEPHQAALNAAKPGLLDANRDFDGKEEWIPPYPGSTVTSWIGAKIPKFCADIAQERWNQSDPSSRSNCALNEVENNEVEYDDCTGVKYLICRCLDAPANETIMAQNFGRLTPGVRSVVSHLMAVDRSQLPGQGGSYSYPRHVLLTSDLPPRFYTHETFHAVYEGFYWSTSQHTADPAGRNPDWYTAEDLDTCYPTQWSSDIENFPQVGLWLHYDKNGMNIAERTGKDASCMHNQLNLVRGYLEKDLAWDDNRCMDQNGEDDELMLVEEFKGVVNVTKIPSHPLWRETLWRTHD